MYLYTDETRESEPMALPDVEVWSESSVELMCSCGCYNVPISTRDGADSVVVDGNNDIIEGATACAAADLYAVLAAPCVSCGGTGILDDVEHPAWWYAFGFPGCMHDSETFGPFDSEAAALADARETSGA